MPSHQRSSANTGRRTHSSSPRHSPAQDYAETLLDELKDKNTELNKANSERDRYLYLYELANGKLSESHNAKEDLKAQVQGLKDDNALLRQKLEDTEKENRELAYQCEVWDENYTVLEKRYKELTDHYNAIAAPVPSSSRGATELPERPKPPHKSSSKKEHKEHKEERPRKGEKENKEQKDRLSRRFDEKRPTSSRGRRTSFIEGWGPGAGGPAASAGSGPRALPVVATTGHGRAPATSPPHNKVAFSSVPRTTNPLSPSLYQASSAAVYDDYDYEDGNYHPHPVGR